MRLWLCLFGLGITCHCRARQDIQVELALDLRTAWRKFLPEEFKEITENSREDDKSVNFTEILAKRNKTGFNENWSGSSRMERSYPDDSNMPEGKRQWLKQMRWLPKDSYELEYNSSEYRDFEASVNRKFEIEKNTTNVFQDDLDDLWDMYMANKTAPPGFPLAFSPRFMYEAYRRYSLGFNNTPVTTTEHWIMRPLTGDQAIKYEKAMERVRKFNISRKDPKRIAEINHFIEKDMEGKLRSNKTRDHVRYYIGLRRRMGEQLGWDKPTISVSKELENMKVPDTNELLDNFKKGLEEDFSKDSVGTPPDIEKLLNAEVTKTTAEQLSTKPRDGGQKKTTKPSSIIPTLYLHNGVYVRSKNGQGQKANFNSISRSKPKIIEVSTASASLRERHDIQADLTAQADLTTQTGTSNSTVTKARKEHLEHPAVKFLRKHKNKFLVGGIACLAVAKIVS